MQRYATPALLLGLIGIVAGGVLRVYRPSWTAAWPAALIVGGLLVLVALYASFSSVRDVFGRRTTKYGLNALVMIVLILGVIALVEAVSYRHNWRVDLTENRRHSLAPQTVKVLKELRVPVKATGFFQPDQGGKRRAEDLLKQYASYSDGKFTWQMVDADRHPLLAKRYGIETYGTVVVEATVKEGQVKEGQVKEEKVLDAEEEKLTNALIRITREGKRVIYFLKGHGERDPASSERTGLSEVKGAVEKLNYETKDLLLARETKIPDDAAIVVVAGPQKDLLPNEAEALEGYIARAGKVFFMADPFQASGLAALLERYGIGLGNDVIIDVNPQGRLLGAGPEVPVCVYLERSLDS
ncbi:MAG: Gldg family protein, partial [Candidatus Rokuibacteriota bacterium]